MALSVFAVLVAVISAKLGIRTWVSAFYRFVWLLGLVFIINLMCSNYGTRPMISGFELPFSSEGVWRAFSIVMQISMAIALSVLLTATTMPIDLIKGLRSLAHPLARIGLPVDEASTATYIALRIVPILQEEVRTIVEAQKSRGIDFRTGGIKRRSRALSSILAPAIQATLRKADKLAAAMAARGYGSNSMRLAFSNSSVSTIDFLALMFSAGVALACVVLKIL